MAAESASTPAPTAQLVGNAFVEQYYHILHKSPELVHRFYQDVSVLSRPDLNGVVTTVTTMTGINQKIVSFGYKKYTAEIKTADAQDSHKEGVIVLVTGTLTGPDNVRKNFTQTFFLAPQDKGYFVLNDVFRFVDDNVVSLENNKVTASGANDSAFAPPTHEPEPAQAVDPPTIDSSTSHLEELQNVEQKVQNITKERELVSEKNVVVSPEPQPNRNHVSEVTEARSPVAPADAPKKSYASILSSHAKKGVIGSNKVYVPTKIAKVAPRKIENKAVAPVVNPQVSAPNGSDSTSIVESKKEPEVEGHSIYVQNLPMNVLVTEVEEEFKKFGPIKKGGVQVRHNTIHGTCFGFVEFESLTSMNNAIKASPVIIKERKTVVEIKRTTTRVGNGGRFTGGRGFRSNSFRGRDNYTGGRGGGYVKNERNEFTNNRGDFGGRGGGRGQGARGGQVYQQGRGRGGRQSGTNRIADST